jgi:glutamate synthase (ferredoxin)
LGYRRLDEIIGRADLLKTREGAKSTKTGAINLDCLLNIRSEKSCDRAFSQIINAIVR